MVTQAFEGRRGGGLKISPNKRPDICEQPLKSYIACYRALLKIFQFTFYSANNGGEKL